MLMFGGAVYAGFDLLMLFAMGLYRRDAILQTRRSLGRIPLVVGMGVMHSVVILYVLPTLSGLPALSHVEHRIITNNYTFPYYRRNYQIVREDVQAGMKRQNLRVEL